MIKRRPLTVRQAVNMDEPPVPDAVSDEASKRGARSRRRGASFERVIAKKFEEVLHIPFKRTPQSGGFAKAAELAADFRGDITIVDSTKRLALHIEAKNQKTWHLQSWLSQAETDCPKDRVPVVVFHQEGTSKDYVALSLDDFFQLVPPENIVKERDPVV